ncbi:MAG: choice-of-anchor D domain-containing protein [Acidobacteriia bacterium]|nr:choice-of-anchor D domain-containing protein [Terriglobia bacterium]
MRPYRLTRCASLLVLLAVCAAGQQAQFALSYVLQSDPNAVVSLTQGGTISFGPTAVNTITQATLSLTNVGAEPGTITSVSITSGAFRLTALPSFPVILPAGGNLQVPVLYLPTGIRSDSGQLTISLQVGLITLSLQGSGSVPNLVYQLPGTDPPTTVPPGGTIKLPDKNVGQTGSVSVRILNTGAVSGTVNTVSVVGQGFQLGTALVLPKTLAPNASVTFTVNFTPSQPGTVNGTLAINSDVIDLTGVGLGSRLEFSYVTAGTTIALGAGNTSVVFSPVMVTESAQLNFAVKNTGTIPAIIANIGVGQLNSPFSLSGVPVLPASLAPGADFQFTISFKPTTLGFSNGTILIDTTTFILTGSGTQPPALPAYTIGGVTGEVTPRSQPRVSLTLAAPYPVAISGTLTLTASGNLPADPAVQFASGGRSVAFLIPANSTGAVFGTSGTQIGFQSGTVAGTIVLTPSFATQAGAIDLTPATPSVLQLTIAPAAPKLIGISLGGQTSTSLGGQTAASVSIAVTGYTTSRSLTNWTVKFTPAAGFNMPKTQFTINVQQVASPWFLGTASQTFGGQFIITVPFSFQGTVATGESLLSGIAAVSVTVDNELGTSNSVQATLQ